MKKSMALKLVNIFLVLSFIGIVLVVGLRRVLSTDIFYAVHPKLGYLFITLAFMHIALNWNWIKSNFLKKKKKIRT